MDTTAMTYAQKNNIPYKTINKSFENEDEALYWAFNKQIGQRNLTPSW